MATTATAHSRSEPRTAGAAYCCRETQHAPYLKEEPKLSKETQIARREEFRSDQKLNAQRTEKLFNLVTGKCIQSMCR